jgi:tetratricopeptide (TPR) repeat protein
LRLPSRNRGATAALAIVVLCLNGCNRSQPTGLVRTAILPATVLTSDQSLAWTEKGLPVVLYQDLSTAHDFVPVVAANDSAAYAANVSRILRTSVDSYHNRLILKATLTDLSTQKNVGEFSVETQQPESFVDSADKLAKKISDGAEQFSTRNDKALIAYLQSFTTDQQKQFGALTLAVRADPAFGLAQSNILEMVANQSPEQALQVIQRAAPYREKFTPLDRARFDIEAARVKKAPVPELSKQVKQLLALAPGDLSALLMLAQLSIAENKVPDAVNHLNDAISMDPGNIQARQMLAGAYLNTRQDEAARKTLRELSALRPTDTNVMRMVAEVEFTSGHLAEAETAYHGLKDAQGLMAAAVCRLLEGDPARAQAAFDESAALRTKDPLLPLSRADWLALNGDRAKAIQLLTSTTMPSPDLQSVAFSQAALYQLLNKNLDAAQQLSQASMKLAQSNVPKSFAIVSSLVAHGSEPEAQFRSRLQNSELDSRSQIPAAAFAYFFAGRFGESLGQWEMLLKASPNDIRSRVMRAATLNRMGRSAEAAKDAPRLLMPNLNGGDEMAVPAFTEFIRVRALAERQAGRADLSDKLNKAIALYKW